MKLKELLLSIIGGNHVETDRPSVVSLRARERLAEEQAEVALNGLRAVRVEFDPRMGNGEDRKRKLASINTNIERQQASIALLKGSLADGR